MELTSLDIGCGFSSNHTKRGLVGLDLEKGLCDIQGDAMKLPFRAESFDRVIASHVLEHLENFGLALEEMMRVLKPAGTLEIEIPNPANFWIFRDYVKSRKACLGNTGLDPSHVCSFGEGDIQNIMRIKGLAVLNIAYKMSSRYERKYMHARTLKGMFYRLFFRFFPALQNAFIVHAKKRGC